MFLGGELKYESAYFKRLNRSMNAKTFPDLLTRPGLVSSGSSLIKSL